MDGDRGTLACIGSQGALPPVGAHRGIQGFSPWRGLGAPGVC